jgi:uncharacterized membrane protein
MLARLKMAWSGVRDSLWFIPAVFTVAAAALALLLVQLEQSRQWELSQWDYWLLTGGVEGSRQVLGTIAGSLITVIGVVFSVTIVALQLASSQFTPRILRNFMADRVNQVVLGAFISTFTYTLLVLRVIRSEAEDDQQFVPHLAVAVAIVLALVSIGCLIYFVHHVARSIQVSVVLSRVAAQALAHVDRLFPEEVGMPDDVPEEELEQHVGDRRIVPAVTEGYLQAVDSKTLFDVGEQQRVLIRMAVPIGAFVVNGQALAEFRSNKPADEDAVQHIRAAFIVGEGRTPEQDLEYCIIEIADIAVKALSPGINDPTTALHCIDRLTQILLALGKRRPPPPKRTKTGQVHFVARETTFETALNLAFGQVTHFGKDNPAVAAKLREACAFLHQLLPGDRHAALSKLQSDIVHHQQPNRP